MPSTTPYYALPLYDKVTDAGEKFYDFRDDVNGTGANSAMMIIDGQMKTNADGVATKLDATQANITYYVDDGSGSDITGDGSSGDPFKTIQHAVDLIPKYIEHIVTIYVVNGTYTEDVEIFFFTGNEFILEATGGYAVVNSITVANSTVQVTLQSIKVTTPDSFILWSASDVKLISCVVQPAIYSVGYGFYIRNNSHVYIYTSITDNTTYGIAVEIGCTAYVENTNGSGNLYGYCANAGVINYSNSTITGTTANRITANNGLIKPLDTTNFDGILSATDTDAQTAFETIDNAAVRITGAQTIAGYKTFSDGVEFESGLYIPDNTDLYFGDSADINMRWDINSTPRFLIKTMGEILFVATPNGSVELYYDNVKKFETVTAGVDITGNLETTGYIYSATNFWVDDNNSYYVGTDGYAQILYDGSNLYMFNTVGNTIIGSGVAWEKAIEVAPNAGVDLYYDNIKKFETVSGGAKITGDLEVSGGSVSVADNETFSVGTGSDVMLSWTGTMGKLDVDSLATSFSIMNGAENMAVFKPNSAVELYYDNVKKFETTTNGIAITGNAYLADNGVLYLGTDLDANIKHNNTDMYITNTTGNILMYANLTDLGIKIINDGAVEFYYDGAKKIETTTAGATITGTLIADTINLADNARIYLGDSNEFEIFVNGSTGFINIDITADMYIGKGVEVLAKFIPDGAVELYYDNVKAIETVFGGAKVTGTLEVTGKIQSTRIKPRTESTTTTATLTINSDNIDISKITAQAGALIVANPTGTPDEGQPLEIWIKDNGTAQTITSFGTSFNASSDLAFPTTTIAGKWMHLGFKYNSTTSKFNFLAYLDNL